MNREDSKGKTQTGGNDTFLLNPLSLRKRINTNLESMLLYCVWPEISQPFCFTLLWPTALHHWRGLDELLLYSIILTTKVCTLSHCDRLPAHTSITRAHCFSQHKLLSVCERFASSLLCIPTLQSPGHIYPANARCCCCCCCFCCCCCCFCRCCWRAPLRMSESNWPDLS